MRKLLCELVSFTLTGDQIESLKSEFAAADTASSGEITLARLKEILADGAAGGMMGAMTEEEVVQVFNSLKMNSQTTTIAYHEFIAACLSLCEIDGRNLRLAFERLDTERKGYISVENAMDMMGCDATEASVRAM